MANVFLSTWISSACYCLYFPSKSYLSASYFWSFSLVCSCSLFVFSRYSFNFLTEPISDFERWNSCLRRISSFYSWVFCSYIFPSSFFVYFWYFSAFSFAIYVYVLMAIWVISFTCAVKLEFYLIFSSNLFLNSSISVYFLEV